MRERRAIISAWQSLSASPRSLMYSPLMHLVPVETQMTCASFTSVPVGGVDTRKTHQLKDEQVEMDKSVVPEGTFSSVALFLKPGCQLSMVGCRTGANLPVVMTTPARTFRRA